MCCNLILAKAKSLLRTVRIWPAGGTEEEDIPLKNVQLRELREGFYIDKDTNSMLAP